MTALLTVSGLREAFVRMNGSKIWKYGLNQWAVQVCEILSWSIDKGNLRRWRRFSENYDIGRNNSIPKLAQLESSPIPWPSLTTAETPRVEIILSHLRIGHTHLTYSHLFSNVFPWTCSHCDSDFPITVSHLFSCPQLAPLRLKPSISDPHLLALSDNLPSVPDLLAYLDSTLSFSTFNLPYRQVHSPRRI